MVATQRGDQEKQGLVFTLYLVIQLYIWQEDCQYNYIPVLQKCIGQM